jgi:hypothetical protein
MNESASYIDEHYRQLLTILPPGDCKMAVMIPSDVENFSTDGERRFYGFLKAVAKPDSNYLVWYLPNINDREPDFILFCKDNGLIIFEVKDWALEQIREANPQNFTLTVNGRNEERESPLKQAKTYCRKLMDKIREDRRLVSKEPQHVGNPKIPIHEVVVFPNINKYEYIRKALDQVIGVDRIFFWDDLHPQSDISRDSSGQTFASALQQKYATSFHFNLTPDELNHLRQLIFPMVRIELPDRSHAPQHEKQQKQNKNAGSQPGSHRPQNRRRTPNYLRPVGVRQNPRSGSPGRASDAAKTGIQTYSFRLLQHHAGQFHQTAAGRKESTPGGKRRGGSPFL